MSKLPPPRRADIRSWRPIARALAFLALLFAPLSVVFGHGAWLDRPNIRFTPATDAQIAANVAAGNAPIKPGDVIELVAEFPSIVNGTLSGPNGYFTFYVPGGTEVVGASIVDASFNDIPARQAKSPVTGEGMSRGWGPQGMKTFDVTVNGWNPSPLPVPCTTYGRTAANCNSGLAHSYGDTGVFYSTRDDTVFYTGDGTQVASFSNGYRINPTSGTPWPSLTGNTTNVARVHNKWDAVQSNAFGSGGALVNPGFSTMENTRINTNGRGTLPYRAGSAVAGPESGSNLDRYGTTGPWQRIVYPGSCYSRDGLDDPANADGTVYPQVASNVLTSVAVCGAPPGGRILSEASPLPAGTNAVRYAIGGIHQGQTYRVKIRLKVIDPSLIKAFNAEAAGGDSTQGAADGKDNTWRYYVGGPGVAAPSVNGGLAINKSIVSVNGQPYPGGGIIPSNATVRYRITYANAGLTAHTNVQLSDVLPTQSTTTSNFTVVSGPNIIPASPPSTGTITFLPIVTLNVAEGGVIEFDDKLTSSAGETVTNQARIASTQRTTPVTSSVSTFVVTINANLQVQKTSSIDNPLGQMLYYLPNEVVIYTIKVTNRGDAITGDSLAIVDAIPPYLSVSMFPFDGSTTEPIKFVDGTGLALSGVSCCNSSQVLYSTDGGVTYSYLSPTSQFDPTITHIKISPAGQMNAGTTNLKEFSILLKAKID